MRNWCTSFARPRRVACCATGFSTRSTAPPRAHPSYGLYSEQEKEILLLVVRQKELPAITAGVKELAPDCFVVVTDAYDAYGYRWKALPDAGTVQIR